MFGFSRQQHLTIPNNDHLTFLHPEHHYPIATMTVIWGLDLKEMQWGKFKSSYMFGNTDYHLRRTKFGIYQGAMILTVVSESLGTAALSGTSPPFPSPPNYLTLPRLRRPTEVRRQPLSRRHGPQQQLRWHRQLQHLRRHLRSHHFRRRLLLRPLLARAPRVPRREDRLARLLCLCMRLHLLMRASVHVHRRNEECVCVRHRCGECGAAIGGVRGQSDAIRE